MQLIPPKAPNMTRAAVTYDAQQQEQFMQQLRLYFNQLDVSLRLLLLGCNSFGCFHQTANVTAAVANTAYPISFNLTHHSAGIILSGSPATTMTVAVTGIYMISFNAQLDSTGGSGLHAHFWIRINGVDETYSANKIVVDSGNRQRVAGWSFQLDLQAGDAVQLMWAVDDTRVFLEAAAAAAPVPAISSVVANIYWVFPNGAT